MLRDDDRITPFELTALMVVTLLEMGVLTLPRILTGAVGEDAWLVPFPALLITLGAVFCMVQLGRLFPGKTFVEYSQEILGRIIGISLIIVVIIFWMSTNARILRQFADVMKANLLITTPIEVIIFSMILGAAYLARHGVEPMARVSIIVFYITVPLGMLFLGLALFQARLGNLLPVLANGPLPILKEGFRVVGSAEGAELLLVLMPFMTRPHKAFTSSVWASFIIWALVFQVTFTCLAVFGAKEVAYLIRPGLVIVQTIELPTLFVERLSSVYVAIWVALVFPSVAMFLFLPATSLSKLFGLAEQKIFIYPLVPFIYLLAILPTNVLVMDIVSGYLELLGVFVILIMPLSLLIIAKVRKMGEKVQ